MKNKNDDEIIGKLKFSKNQDLDWKKLFLSIYKENAATINVLQSNIEIYEVDKIVGDYEPSEVTDIFKKEILSRNFSVENIQLAINNTKEKSNKNGKDLFMPIRKFSTGKEHGPELAKAIFLFGENKVLARIK